MQSVAAAFQKEGKDLNLINLHRLDAGVDSVLYTASFVVLYTLQEANMAWARRNTEGPMFWVRRSSIPWHKLVVLNRLSSINVNEDLERSMEFEFQKPFAFYRSSTGEVVAIWFSQQQDFDEFRQQWQTFISSKPVFTHTTTTPRRNHLTPDVLRTAAASASSLPSQPASYSTPITSKTKDLLLSPDYLLKPSPAPVYAGTYTTSKNLTRDQFENSLQLLVQNKDFIDQLYRRYCDRQHPS